MAVMSVLLSGLTIRIQVVAEKCSLIQSILFGGSCGVTSLICCFHESLCSADDEIELACGRKCLLNRKEVAISHQEKYLCPRIS